MRIHFAVATPVLLLASPTACEARAEALLVALVRAHRRDVNTAIERTIASPRPFDPMAKVAKDIASGSVLIASWNAVVIGTSSSPIALRRARTRRAPPGAPETDADRDDHPHLIVIASKALTRRGDELSGGLRGHAALAFGGCTAIEFIVDEEQSVVAPSFP